MFKILILLCLVISSIHQPKAAIYTVGTDAACDFNTIQSAIDFADVFDTTWIYVTNQKIWFENLQIADKKRINISGQFLSCENTTLGENKTVIDASSSVFKSGVNIFRSYGITLERLTIQNASGGGVIVNQSEHNPEFGHTFLLDVVLKNNTRNSFEGFKNGGGLAVFNDSKVSLSLTTIKNNTAANGGGIYCDNSEVYIHNPDIFNNTTLSVDTDSSFGKGGGIYASNLCQLDIITTKTITSFGKGIDGNIASFSGGGIFADSQAQILLNTASSFSRVPLTIANNKVIYTGDQPISGGGGGIAAIDFGTEITAYRLILNNNEVNSSINYSGGGALFIQSATLSIKRDNSTKSCTHILPIENNTCNQIINNHTTSRGGMLYQQSNGNVEINQTFISGNFANGHQLVANFSGQLKMQGNIITNNGMLNDPFSSELFYIGSTGLLTVDFTTFKDNYLPMGYLINGFQSKQIEVTRSIIDESSNTSVYLDSSSTGTNLTTFTCLLSHESSSFFGQLIVVGSPSYQATWPFHLTANSLGVNLCQANEGSLAIENDLDGDERGPCSGAICGLVPRRFDTGADEYRITDLIFKHGFE